MPRRLRAALRAASGSLAARFVVRPALVSVPVLVLGMAACAGKATPPPAPKEQEPAVRLVVLLAVDQLRPDRLSESMTGGLGRIVKEGRAFVDGALEHAFTETCPGHAVMLTGRHPSRIGIPANGYIDPETLESRYCVEDRAADAALVGLRGPAAAAQQPTDGRSPRIMKYSGLGDWMKSRRPETKVFSVSGKDRAAITMGGLRPDGAYWLARGPDPSWVTSGYYRQELPAWAADLNGAKVLEGLPPDWSYLPEVSRAAAKGLRIDDYPHESPLLSRTQPHPLLADPGDVARLPDRARHPADRVYVSPFADRVTLSFARRLIESERLGQGDGPDLLAISLSATDLVGHFYGPDSWESQDAIFRLDRMVGDFLDFLDREVGEDAWVLVLTADHGVLEIPEWIHENGRSQCPVAGGRVDPKPILAHLEAQLDAEHPQTAVHDDAPWFVVSSSRLTLNRGLTGRDKVLEAKVMASATTFLEAQPGIVRVWSREEVLLGEGPEPMASRFRHSWVPEISGDLAIEVHEDCLLAGHRIATSHGSPHGYDRKVPLIFLGPDIEAGRIYETPASPLDIAPTLAAYLDLPAPVGLDGRVLKLKER